MQRLGTLESALNSLPVAPIPNPNRVEFGFLFYAPDPVLLDRSPQRPGILFLRSGKPVFRLARATFLPPRTDPVCSIVSPKFRSPAACWHRQIRRSARPRNVTRFQPSWRAGEPSRRRRHRRTDRFCRTRSMPPFRSVLFRRSSSCLVLAARANRTSPTAWSVTGKLSSATVRLLHHRRRLSPLAQ